MTRLFIYTTPFRNAWKAMGLNDSDLVQLEEALLENPQKGDVIEGTDGARKLRIQIGNHGKSGGGRVIYLDVLEREHLYLRDLPLPAVLPLRQLYSSQPNYFLSRRLLCQQQKLYQNWKTGRCLCAMFRQRGGVLHIRHRQRSIF